MGRHYSVDFLDLAKKNYSADVLEALMTQRLEDFIHRWMPHTKMRTGVWRISLHNLPRNINSSAILASFLDRSYGYALAIHVSPISVSGHLDVYEMPVIPWWRTGYWWLAIAVALATGAIGAGMGLSTYLR